MHWLIFRNHLSAKNAVIALYYVADFDGRLQLKGWSIEVHPLLRIHLLYCQGHDGRRSPSVSCTYGYFASGAQVNSPNHRVKFVDVELPAYTVWKERDIGVRASMNSMPALKRCRLQLN